MAKNTAKKISSKSAEGKNAVNSAAKALAREAARAPIPPVRVLQYPLYLPPCIRTLTYSPSSQRLSAQYSRVTPSTSSCTCAADGCPAASSRERGSALQ